MEGMTKFQLIEAMKNDLGDHERGLQVQGYRNMKIVTGTIEGLNALQQGLAKDDEAIAKAIKEKDETIARLQAELDALKIEAVPEDQEAAHED